MARLSRKRTKLKPSKAEAKGLAAVKLRFQGQLSVPAAADYLGIHKYTLRDYIRSGHVYGLEIGSRVHLGETELQRLKGLIAQHGSLAKAFKQSKG